MHESLDSMRFEDRQRDGEFRLRLGPQDGYKGHIFIAQRLPSRPCVSHVACMGLLGRPKSRIDEPAFIVSWR
jgi:hypothetical protein